MGLSGNMTILKIRLVDRFIYINADKIIFFEENKTGFTRLFLEGGKAIDLPHDPDEFFSQLVGSEKKDDDLVLTDSDLRLIFQNE